jgi:hypothetical protein
MTGPEKDQPVDVEVFVHRITMGDRGGMLVSVDGDEARALWIPKSQVIDEDRDSTGIAERGGRLTDYRALLTVPAWLAQEKGLDGEHRAPGTDDLFGGGHG